MAALLHPHINSQAGVFVLWEHKNQPGLIARCPRLGHQFERLPGGQCRLYGKVLLGDYGLRLQVQRFTGGLGIGGSGKTLALALRQTVWVNGLQTVSPYQRGFARAILPGNHGQGGHQRAADSSSSRMWYW